MIKLIEVDKKLHGDALTTYLSKKGIDYKLTGFTSTRDDVFDILINEESASKVKVSVSWDTVNLTLNCPANDGYDIGRNEFYMMEVI